MFKHFQNKYSVILFAAVLWQFISIALLAVAAWPPEIVWVNFGLLLVLTAMLPKVQALGLFLVSLPFMVVLPENLISSLPMWRPLAGWLFVVLFVKHVWERWENKLNALANLKILVQDFYTKKLNRWDKWLAGLLVIASASLLVADFPEHGFKQILFFVNVYLLYLSSLLAVGDMDDWSKLTSYVRQSLLITVALGFIQFFATFFADPYDFWQYWATLVSSVYYGVPLSDVLAYSNSWFSAEGGQSSLRMFGILQDTHAFAVIAIFGLALWWAYAKIQPVTLRVRHIFADQSRWYWVIFVALCFAIITSGTRGVWVALGIPIAATMILIYKFKARLLGALPLLSYTLIIILFLLSPWLTMSFNWLRSVALEDNILKRVSSVYDLSEASNVGRLEIWQGSLKYSLQHPLGTGYGNFVTSIVDVPEGASFEDISNQKNYRYNLPQKFVTAHSLYLHLLVELGLLGLLIFSMYWWSVGRQVWQAISESHFAFTTLNVFFVAIAIAFLWLLAYGLFDVTIVNERVLLYLMTLLALLNIALRNKPATLF